LRIEQGSELIFGGASCGVSWPFSMKWKYMLEQILLISIKIGQKV